MKACKTYEEILLQVIEDSPRLLLAAKDARESLLGHAAILELTQHELVVAGEKRAAGVAVILGHGCLVLAGQGGDQVVDEDGRLGGDGSSSLAVREARCVTK